VRGQSLAGLLCGVVPGRPLVEIEAGRVKGESAGLSDRAADGRGVGEARHAVGSHAAGVLHQLAERALRPRRAQLRVGIEQVVANLVGRRLLAADGAWTLKLPLLSGSAKSGTPCERMHLA
jgi:hypothetical protein